jgi:group I intron endonuclease
MTNYGIYCIKNLINNKIYIGSSINLKKRITTHKWLLNKNNHFNKYLQNSWDKYGEINFSFTIIKTLYVKNELLLRKYEEYYIKSLKALYNEWGFNINNRTDIIYNNFRPVFKFNLEGNLIKKYASIKDAFEDSKDKSMGSIRDCCTKKISYSHDFTYRYCEDFKLDEEVKIQKILKREERYINENIYDNEPKYNFKLSERNSYFILCYNLKGELINIFNEVKDASEFFDLNKTSIFNRLKENNRIITSNNLRLRAVKSYIFIRMYDEDIIQFKIRIGIKLLHKINILTNEVEKIYENLGRKNCSKELNVTPCVLDSYIRNKKIINGFLYEWREY